jgi:hypothetical protein
VRAASQEATIGAGVPVGRHTHPGIESAFIYVVEKDKPLASSA